MIESLTFRVELEFALAFVRDPNETPETLGATTSLVRTSIW